MSATHNAIRVAKVRWGIGALLGVGVLAYSPSGDLGFMSLPIRNIWTADEFRQLFGWTTGLPR